ncbi:exopolysaccharide export protein [Pseudorhizobium endolithicum]|uniref:Exopolysaccharide export protein n=1 Tax=Pseudorhizobium endolithicum TaxID=1191678 RepID=A0ABM8PRJ1_9HYPH|nr:oligosaccharide flippase family protein [Pseudorhizobium endolithicum]CAD7044526.1 exopolysaccharide export protein [Pseudorhizobium endolithicum]
MFAGALGIMRGVRNAFLFATLGEYLALIISFITVAVVSHLMTPAEIGLSVVGMGVVTLIFSLREFATCDFLIQLDTVKRQDVCTAMTLMIIGTIMLAALLFFALPWLSVFFESEILKTFFLLMIGATVIESLSRPGMSLFRRDMMFGKITMIKTAATLATALITIYLAVLGWGVVSFSLGAIAGACITASLTLAIRQDWWSFKPSLQSLTKVAEFGRYKGATNVVDQFYNALPNLILGGIMSTAEVGKYSRAVTISNLADRVVLSGVFTVAFPALAAAVREKVDIRKSFLGAISSITVVYWPALLMVAFLAAPLVDLLLGPGWEEVTPVARILALSALFWFPNVLTYPLLIGLGANRPAFMFNIICRSLAAAISCAAAFLGLMAIAYSQFISLPLQMLIALIYVRRYVYFSWMDLFQVLWPSALVSACTVVGPLLMSAYLQYELQFSLVEAIYACAFALVGWYVGLVLSGHAFLNEISALLEDSGKWVRGRAIWLGRSAN